MDSAKRIDQFQPIGMVPTVDLITELMHRRLVGVVILRNEGPPDPASIARLPELKMTSWVYMDSTRPDRPIEPIWPCCVLTRSIGHLRDRLNLLLSNQPELRSCRSCFGEGVDGHECDADDADDDGPLEEGSAAG